MANSDMEWKHNTRPESTLAISFSAALDDLFKLNGIDALEESVEQKKDEVQLQQNQLQDLEQRLREADERLKRLEAKHRRQSQIYAAARRSAVRAPSFAEEREDDTSGDSDGQGRSSPQSEPGRRS